MFGRVDEHVDAFVARLHVILRKLVVGVLAVQREALDYAYLEARREVDS